MREEFVCINRSPVLLAGFRWDQTPNHWFVERKERKIQHIKERFVSAMTAMKIIQDYSIYKN
jgi:hypothetical protein